MVTDLRNREVNGGEVKGTLEDGYELCNPAMDEKKYCLAQVDNYMHLSRRNFPHHPPFTLQLEARVSNANAVGTWGFGLWNDPFSLGFGAGGMSRLMPVPPNAAWFFYASTENHLALRDDQPGNGFHVKVFRSPLWPSILSLLGTPGLPLLLLPPASRLIRRLSRAVVKEESQQLQVPNNVWHVYRLSWRDDTVSFDMDGKLVYETSLTPQGRMGLVIWIDNQYFRFDPQGKLGFGYLKIPQDQSLFVRNLKVPDN